MSSSTNINSQTVVNKIQTIFKELNEQIDVEKLTSEDRKDILLDLDNLEDLVLSFKEKVAKIKDQH